MFFLEFSNKYFSNKLFFTILRKFSKNNLIILQNFYLKIFSNQFFLLIFALNLNYFLKFLIKIHFESFIFNNFGKTVYVLNYFLEFSIGNH